MFPRPLPVLPAAMLLLFSALPGAAWAQDAAAPSHPPTGKGDLDRAMALCDAHRAPGAASDAAPAWTPGWEACRGADGKWQRAWARKDASDRAFVAQVARSGS